MHLGHCIVYAKYKKITKIIFTYFLNLDKSLTIIFILIIFYLSTYS